MNDFKKCMKVVLECMNIQRTSKKTLALAPRHGSWMIKGRQGIDSGIEVVEATSAEEELIRRELSKSIDPKENVQTDKEVEEEINRNIMMIAKMAVSHSEMGPLPSFDLGIDFGSQKTEKHRNTATSRPRNEDPRGSIQKREDMITLCYKWATKPEGNNEYQYLYRFKTGKEYEAMRYHFTSMAEEVEMDLAIVQIMCILYNRENNEKFKYTTYCVPSLFLHNILEKYGPYYIDTKTGLPYKIETMPNLDALDYIDENKIKSAPFLFAPILYSHHWWLYVLDVTHRKFYVLDSKDSEPRLGDRNKPNRFASNVLDQMRVRAGAEMMFPRMTRNMVTHSLFPKYISVPKQPNAFDCDVYVLNYMDIVNPSLLGKKNFTVPVWTEDELQRFREEFVERILYDGDNYYRHQVIKASNPVTRQPRPSTALQSPYTQLKSADLESRKIRMIIGHQTLCRLR
ncbi:hypothetical protein PIB30_083249 [Stylosanthes scabra]|uniref:Ubiquitin-like protease family profile domain-containing protein n=1 Tax=Stylosanthes scabra TaxID=79078 RepID=A0ABU6ZR29_9FABA|nr:hypothetical protein [Stylosanthes scabra]